MADGAGHRGSGAADHYGITTEANLWADWGSRGQLERVLAQAEQLQLPWRRCAVPAAWRDVLAWEVDSRA